jgi:hypothetical protein
MNWYIWSEDLAAGSTGPFASFKEALNHINTVYFDKDGQPNNGAAACDCYAVVPEILLRRIEAAQGYANNNTPEEDIEMHKEINEEN